MIETLDEVEEYIEKLRQKQQAAPDIRDVLRSTSKEPANCKPSPDEQNETGRPTQAAIAAPSNLSSRPRSDNNKMEPDDLLEIHDLEFYINFVRENLKEDLEKKQRFKSLEAKEVGSKTFIIFLSCMKTRWFNCPKGYRSRFKSPGGPTIRRFRR